MLSHRFVRQLTDSKLPLLSHPPTFSYTVPRDGVYVRKSVLSARHVSSASSTRWKARQSRDRFAKDAKLKGLKSRAAFKLLEVRLDVWCGGHSTNPRFKMDEKYKLFRQANTVVDLVRTIPYPPQSL